MYSRVPPSEGSMSCWRGVSSPQRPTQLHKVLTLFFDESRHKGSVDLPLSESFEAESGAFTRFFGHRTTTKSRAPKSPTNLFKHYNK